MNCFLLYINIQNLKSISQKLPRSVISPNLPNIPDFPYPLNQTDRPDCPNYTNIQNIINLPLNPKCPITQKFPKYSLKKKSNTREVSSLYHIQGITQKPRWLARARSWMHRWPYLLNLFPRFTHERWRYNVVMGRRKERKYIYILDLGWSLCQFSGFYQ